MIDWESSGINSDSVKNKDTVVVVCDSCGHKRYISYLAAKRRDIHLCMSCIKKKDIFCNGEVVEHTCRICGIKKKIKYRAGRYKNWRCHSCGLKQAHIDGSIGPPKTIMTDEIKAKLSSSIKKIWTNPEYRSKQSESRSRTKAERSAIARIVWSDSERLARLSESLRMRWQDDEYRNKVTKILRERWNNEEYKTKQRKGYTGAVRQKMALLRSKQLSRVSSIQLMLYRYLEDLGVEYYPEHPIGYYVWDCLVIKDNRKYLIDCNGDYWHAIDATIIKDKAKFTYTNNYFPEYEILYIWEHEFYVNNAVLSRLKEKFDTDIVPIDFDFKNINIKQISTADARSFLDAYHYIGGSRGGVCFGAYLNDKLIGCLLFSNPIRQNVAQQFDTTDDNIYELSRLCIHPCYHKKNFASWFISKCIKKVNKKVIVAYADTTVGHVGTVYKACGFILHHTVQPDYWYVDEKNFAMHKRTLYGRARKMCMSESEYAAKYGYSKVYGDKKLCYTYSRSR